MSARTYALIASAVAVLAGLILLLTPVSASAENVNLTCGTAVSPSSQQAVLLMGQRAESIAGTGPSALVGTYAAEAETSCGDAVATRQIWSWLLVGLGPLVAIGAVVVTTMKQSDAAPVG